MALVSRREDALKTVAEAADGSTLVAPADVRDAAVDAVVEWTPERFGKVDSLINNVGVGLLSLADGRKRIVDVTEEEWVTGL